VRAIEGLDAAIARAQAFVEAGADVTFVEAPLEAAELERIARDIPVPQIANMVFGGLTPALPQSELKSSVSAACSTRMPRCRRR